jgi:acyl-[acyl-carrier-protein]-phospholipid O-acyltransferase/long-chain-fatty-acid--[acyl-carrier-protein] ligase
LTDPSGKSLRGLLVSQFFGAFNDNALKLFAVFLAIRVVSDSEKLSQLLTTIAFVVFTLPLMVFSFPAGFLADRLSKRTVIVAMKAVEIGLMAAGTVVLFVFPSGWVLLFVVLGLMGVQSALFSPAKYGVLPEIVPHERLSAANGALQLYTFLAIIAGTATGGVLLDATGNYGWIAGMVLTMFSVIGFIAARRIQPLQPARTEGSVVEATRGAWKAIRGDRVLWLAVLGCAFYWGIASLLGQDILVYSKALTKHLAHSDILSGLTLAVFGVAVGAGSMLAGKLSASKIEYGLIPLGALGLGLFTMLLGILAPGFQGTLVLMVFLGISSGLIVVPLYALLQWRSPPEQRGTVIALSNIFTFASVLAGSLAAGALALADFSSRAILLACAVATVAGTAWALWLLPTAFLRLVLILLTHTFYRLKVTGRENVPGEGGALLVANHVSFADGLFLIASMDRRIRFIVGSTYFHHPLLKPFMKSLGFIPISSSEGPRVVLRALRDAGKYLDEGELVCIFPEGQLTRTGALLPFRRGMEKITSGHAAPIVPIYLDRVWGSIFSYAKDRFVWKIPERIPYPVTVSIGSPLPPETPLHEVRRAVQGLSEAAWIHRKNDSRPLHRTFIRTARKLPRRLALSDLTRPRVSRFGALAAAIALARALRRHWKGQRYVGILLPPSVAGALVNLAASLAGRASVNLNFTAGRAGMNSAVKQTGLRTVVTSRTFMEKAGIELPEGVETLYAEDIAGGIGPGARALAGCLAAFAPTRFIERICGAERPPAVDDVASVIFSSGSTGEPKGVMLTHFNVDSNVEACAQVFRVQPEERILGILPLFHSFGNMMLWFGLNCGAGIVFHPNPLDAGTIGELTRRHRGTMLLATPTFLQLYLRRCTPEQFGSLRFVMAGAEKLSEKLSLAFEERFGIRPLEGYGMTECSPVVATSTLDYRAPGFYQTGSRRGFVGQPLPGVAVRIVDPDTFEPLPPETPGMLLVKGPNVMRGYLAREDLTAKVLRDGWYVTGDVASLDQDGFLKITGRLSRFSKIGGEMVPHGRVEGALQEAAAAEAQVFAVTAVPDERKGEQLAVLHTLDEEKIPEILEKVASMDLPNLFIPRRDHFIKVEKLPLLGTGKLDLREAKRVAMEMLAPARPQ